MLSPQEFSHFIIDPSTPPALAQLFRNDPTLTAILRSYLFLTHSMDHLEHALERHRVEQLVLFERLVDSRIFEPRVEPLIRDFRQRTRRYRIRPYNRPSSLIPTSSSLNTSPTSSVVEIRNRGRSVNSLLSHPIDSEEFGTRGNPIYVLGDDECEGCHENGHVIGHCTREYRLVGNQYVPITVTENMMEPTYIVDAEYYRQQQ
jgi:hypothetical protein